MCGTLHWGWPVFEAKHPANMEGAIHIEWVNIMWWTTIELHRGSSGHNFIDRRSCFYSVLKGVFRRNKTLREKILKSTLHAFWTSLENKTGSCQSQSSKSSCSANAVSSRDSRDYFISVANQKSGSWFGVTSVGNGFTEAEEDRMNKHDNCVYPLSAISVNRHPVASQKQIFLLSGT